MTDIALGMLLLMAQVFSTAVDSFFEFVVNPLLTFFVESFVNNQSSTM